MLMFILILKKRKQKHIKKEDIMEIKYSHFVHMLSQDNWWTKKSVKLCVIIAEVSIKGGKSRRRQISIQSKS